VNNTMPIPGFGQYVKRQAAAGQLVVQPRMGFSAAERMREGLTAVKRAAGSTAGTITLDSYTRINRHASAQRHLDEELTLNGYPIVAYGPDATKAMLDGIALRMNQERDSKAVVVGYSDAGENQSLAMRRANNVKTYLTRTKGIDAGRIETRAGTGGAKKAEIWIVPAGATMP